jgi:leader peptidase (prepilin peptidase) / N-methyltransferase
VTPYSIASFISILGFSTVMVGVVTYDFMHTLIPIPFLQALYAFAAITPIAQALATSESAAFLDGIYGMVVVGGFFALINVVTKGRGMGMGDAYVGGAVGLLLGLSRGILAGVFGVWIGALMGILALIVMRLFPRMQLSLAGTRVTLSAELPFAPFLAVGALLAYALPISLISIIT